MSPSPSICLTDSFVSLCLPLFGPGCFPAWTPVTALWGGGVHLSPFVSLHLCPVVSQPGCLARLSGWTGSFVTLCLPSFVSRCVPAWMPGTALWVDGFICLPLSPFICLARLSSLHLSPVVSQPGCLARLSRRTDSLVFLCLPSFVPRCLPAWMPGTALWVDSFTCLPLSPPCLPAWMSVTALQAQADGFTCLPWFPFICLPSLWVDGLICLPLSPFICLPFSPSLDASLGGRIHLSPFVSLCLSPVVSQPGCPSGWTDSFVSRCLPARMCGTHAPRFPSLPAVLSFWRGLVCLRLRPWLRSFLVLWMLGTGSSVCPSSGLRFRLGSWWVVYQLRPLSVLARIWSPELCAAVHGFSYEKALLTPR